MADRGQTFFKVLLEQFLSHALASHLHLLLAAH